MNQHSEIIAIIPARGGSRGIPRKNVQLLGGSPLVAWSIQVARRCDGIDRVIVSTDDTEIAAISREYGAEVPFLRPPELSRDDSLIGEAETHAIRQLEAAGSLVGGYLTLYPTHPFRTPDMLEKAVAAVRSGHHFKTVKPIRVRPGQYVTVGEDGTLCPVTPMLPGLCLGVQYRSYGLISAFARGEVSGRVVFYPVTDPVALVDIDTPADLERARAIAAEGGLHA